MNQDTQYHLHQAFVASEQPHILMITNHGIHQWEVVPGLPDTGGQNVFVNQFTDTLVDFGYKITVVNRGGYPHPLSGDMHTGIVYRDGHRRILYAEDNHKAFVRKEDMDEHTEDLSTFLSSYFEQEDSDVDMIISHYWDAAKIGVLFNRTLQERVPHIWVPHSLGEVKKRNMPPKTWEDLRVDERIEVERSLLSELDGVAATSSLIRQSLKEDYHYDRLLFLPPCVKTDRYYPREVADDHDIWTFLAEHTELTGEELRNRTIITEISRTDQTKRKDLLIKAFARVHEKNPNTFLALSVDETEVELAGELHELIDELGITAHTATLGYVWEQLPDLYAVTDIYCSPSVMEGFGMTPQEAAATRVPVVGSDLIPFVVEYLLGEKAVDVEAQGEMGPMRIGEGAIVVPAENVDGFVRALNHLVENPELRREMGDRAFDITIPYFTWQNMTGRFLEAVQALTPAPERA